MGKSDKKTIKKTIKKIIERKYIVLLVIIFFIFSVFIIFKLCYKIEYFKGNKSLKNDNEYDNEYDTEIHFISFWEKNNINAKSRLNKEISLYNNNNKDKIRIIDKIIIDKNNINELFKKVGTGGKHNLHNIEVYFLEVPNIYKNNPTHDYPEGELVNDIMYKLKKSTRGDYKNYKVAHGSFNKEEVNDFTDEYFKYLGNFKNYEEVFDNFKKTNLFWFSDRVTFETNDRDIDLVVDSIPATCFLLRLNKYHNKSYVNLNGKSKLFDLQDFDSNYYPTEWLLDIKNNNKIISENNIIIPTEKDHFMLGLYHMYIHKNGNQSKNRLNKLNAMSNKLNIKNDITSLIDFLNINNYNIESPIDKQVEFFIDNKTEGGGKNKQVYKYDNRYFYLYNDKNIYNKYLDIYNKLEKFNFIPKILYNNKTSQVIEMENVGERLNRKSKIKNLKKKIDYIRYKINENNIIHNDITLDNITSKDGNIYLIDWDHAFNKNQKNNRKDLDRPYFCTELPQVKNDSLIDYIDNNECLYHWI